MPEEAPTWTRSDEIQFRILINSVYGGIHGKPITEEAYKAAEEWAKENGRKGPNDLFRRGFKTNE